MRRTFIMMIAVLLFAACTEPSPTVRDNHDRAYLLVLEVDRLAGLRSLWPGFEPTTVPLAIYDGEWTFLFRHPAPPEGFVPVEGGELPGHVYEGRYPSVTANSSADIGGTMSATLKLDGIEKDRALTDLATVAIHEAFHVYQRERHPSWQANEAALFVYPTDNARFLALRRLETESFRRALAAPDSIETACWARRAIALRAERFARMDAEFSSYERGTELNEGLATYVEMRAEDQDTVALPENGFGAAEVRQRAYLTGPAIALLLDKFDPEWQASFDAEDGQILEQALQVALGADQQDVSDQCAFSDFEVAEAGSFARDDAAAVVEGQVERRAAFEDVPGWRVVVLAADGEPLWPQGFDPLNVERVQSDILHTRFLHLGNDSGTLEAMDTEATDMEALTEGVGPHPLFNGVERVVIAGLEKPEVRMEDKHATISAPGFAASFKRATMHEDNKRLILELERAE